MATSLHKQGRYSEAEAMHREGVAIKRKVRGDEHPTTLDSAGSLANALSRQGKFAEAATIQREVLEVKKRLFGTEHESTLACANDMGQILVGQEKFSQAEAMHRETHAAGKRTNGAPHACGGCSGILARGTVCLRCSSPESGTFGSDVPCASMISCWQVPSIHRRSRAPTISPPRSRRRASTSKPKRSSRRCGGT